MYGKLESLLNKTTSCLDIKVININYLKLMFLIFCGNLCHLNFKNEILIKYSLLNKQGNLRYHTSPALCNPTTPFAADRPHRRRPKFSEYYLRLPGTLNDPFCYMTLLVIE